jgi:hypothetical protein
MITALASAALLAGTSAATAGSRAGSNGPSVAMSGASIVASGSGVSINIYVRCQTKRLFALNLFAVAPTNGAIGWVNYPGPGAPLQSFTCGPTTRKLQLVAAQDEHVVQKKFEKGNVRVCSLVRGWAYKAPSTLESVCYTLSLS